MIKFVDLFAGLGGFHLAMRKLEGKCVFASEIDSKLQSIYEENFGIRPAGDIRKIKPSEIPSHHVLCAGFPCQPFSKAGDQIGWKDAVRGTVFNNVLNILKVHRTEFVILENVAHFVRHDKGNTYRKVEKALRSLGYSVSVAQLSPHQFGVPQIRERMYMVARLGNLEGFEWPQVRTKADELCVKDVLDCNPSQAVKLSEQVIRCLETWQEFICQYPKDIELPSFPIWSMEFMATYPYEIDSLYEADLSSLRNSYGPFGQSLDFRFRKQILSCLPSYARARKGAFPEWKRLFIKQNRELYETNKKWIDPWLPEIKKFPPSLQKLEWNCKGEERDIWKYIIQFRASGVRVKRPTTSPSLVAMTTTQVPIIAWEQRYMTVQECARLQSMDELKYLPRDTATLKALGNAVNVTVAYLVLQKLLKLKGASKRYHKYKKVHWAA